jgi:hypothetical protein
MKSLVKIDGAFFLRHAELKLVGCHDNATWNMETRNRFKESPYIPIALLEADVVERTG